MAVVDKNVVIGCVSEGLKGESNCIIEMACVRSLPKGSQGTSTGVV